MFEPVIIECDVAYPSVSSAIKLVPREFADGYRLFQDHQGEVVPHLPFGRCKPAEVAYPLVRQSGIQSPKPGIMRYPSRWYAISIHSSDLGRCPNEAPVELGDSSWVFDYSSQDNDPSSTLVVKFARC